MSQNDLTVIVVGSTQNLQRIWYESTINTQMLLLKQLKNNNSRNYATTQKPFSV